MDIEQDKLKLVITERFINALDYLIDSGRVQSAAEVERMTGIRQQRFTGMRACLSGKAKSNALTGIHHIKIFHDMFDVSLDYVYNGIMPIVIDKSLGVFKDQDRGEYGTRSTLELKDELNILKQRVELLSEKVEFYKELVNRKL